MTDTPQPEQKAGDATTIPTHTNDPHQMGKGMEAAGKTEQPTGEIPPKTIPKIGPAPHRENPKEVPYIGPAPGRGQPQFGRKIPNFDGFYRWVFNVSNAIGKLAVKGLLVAAALTGFIKKETPVATAENPAPKATLTAGALGMTLMKTHINNGNQKTDFDGKLLLTETANEIVNNLAPELTTKPFFEKNPIENGVFGKSAKELLHEASAKKPAQQTMTVQEMAEKTGKIPGRD